MEKKVWIFGDSFSDPTYNLKDVNLIFFISNVYCFSFYNYLSDKIL